MLRIVKVFIVGALSAASGAGPSLGCTINIFDRVHFSAGSAVLDPEVHQPLRHYADWLSKHPAATVTIEGHADDPGGKSKNLKLSQRRSAAVLEFLLAAGAPAGQLSIAAYGSDRPVALCEAEACWAQNRRAVLVFTSELRPALPTRCDTNTRTE